jgi:antitoxin component HigA of HigAB toxin-antitoxin module
MHGDDNVGESHDTEDKYLKFKPALDTGPKEKSGPNDAEKTFHRALMHGDEEHGISHDERKTDKAVKQSDSFGPKDTNKMIHDVMHGDSETSHDHVHSQKSNTETKEFVLPPDAEKIMHDVLMHGNNKSENHHVHSRPEEESTKSKGPLDQNNLMHDLMHNGEHVDHASDKPKEKQTSSSGPNSDKLHEVLMHGDSETGDNHDHDHKHSKTDPFKFNMEEIKKLGIDPEILKTILPDDKEDYKKWQEKRKDDDDYKATYALISDSLLSDIELMKQRYLAHDPVEEAEINAYVEGKDSDLAAGDIVDVFDNLVHDDEDTLHDLELIGSTQPINEIHRRHTDRKRKEEI